MTVGGVQMAAERDAAVSPAWHVLHFPGVSPPIVLPDQAALTDGLDMILRGWVPHVETTDAPSGQALACLVPESAEEQTWTLHSLHLDQPMPRLAVASAVCGLIADLGQQFFEERPGSLALHCGAFRLGGQVIALTGAARAGKSTLIARLTAEADVEVLCDDVLPITKDGQAFGLGVAPRLRLPLPDRVSAAFRAHVAHHLGPQDARYGYLCAPNVAPHGTMAPVAALVLLDRRSDLAPGFHAVGKDEALTELLRRNMADLLTPDRAFQKASMLISDINCVRLIYDDLEDAVALLRQAFDAPGPLESRVAVGPEIPVLPPAIHDPSRLSRDERVRRNDGVAVRRLGASAFLWHPDGTVIWQLNPVAAAVWALLEIPGSARDLAEVLSDLFPEVPTETLTEDIVSLLQGLVEADFATLG